MTVKLRSIEPPATISRPLCSPIPGLSLEIRPSPSQCNLSHLNRNDIPYRHMSLFGDIILTFNGCIQLITSLSLPYIGLL